MSAWPVDWCSAGYGAAALLAAQDHLKQQPDEVQCPVQVSDLYDPRNPWASYLINAINAKELQKKDVSYIVRGDQVPATTCCAACNVMHSWWRLGRWRLACCLPK